MFAAAHVEQGFWPAPNDEPSSRRSARFFIDFMTWEQVSAPKTQKFNFSNKVYCNPRFFVNPSNARVLGCNLSC